MKKAISVLVVIVVLFGCVPSKRKPVESGQEGSTAADRDAKHAVGFQVQSASTRPTIQLGEWPRELRPWNVTMYGDAIVIIGGAHQSTSPLSFDRNDVLVSSDAKTWSRLVTNLFSPERYEYSVGVFSENLVVVGGADTPRNLGDDIIDQKDVFLFDQRKGDVLRVPLPAGRSLSAVVEYRGALYVVGGTERSKAVDTVIRATSAGSVVVFQIRGAASLQVPEAWVSDERLFVTDRAGSFWESKDGKEWSAIEIVRPFFPRTGYSVIARGAEWFLVGGSTTASIERDAGPINDVWKSTDFGRNWEQIALEAREGGMYRTFPARQYCVGLVREGKLLVGGGEGIDGNLNDFWESSDGVTWKELK